MNDFFRQLLLLRFFSNKNLSFGEETLKYV